MRRMKRADVAALIALLAAGLGVQLYFFHAYPQPYLFGDPRGYYEAGQRFLDALASVRAGGSLGAAFDSVRGLFLLLGIGTIFATLEALRPGDFAFFRVVFALFNTLGMLGTFLLGRRLARSNWGGWLGLALAAVYPAFAVQTGRLYPDPVTGCLFVWAAWFYLAGVERESRRLLVACGLTLTAALLVRTQIVTFMFVVLPLAFVASAALWARQPRSRRLALALALALTPLPLTWWAIGRAVGQRDDVLRFGNLTYQTPYPIGFWMFIESDGWPGPVRFKEVPYYLEMLRENQQRPGLISSPKRQIGFTARYVAARPMASALTVLDNGYRLYAHPANDYKWDYPFDYDAQVVVHQGVCLLALAGLVLFASEGVATLGVFLLPLGLLALHGVMFAWPRYNVPVMPILLAAAGACGARLATSRALREAARARTLLWSAALAAVTLGLGLALFSAAPEWARALRLVGRLAALALPFLWVARLGVAPRAKYLAALACGGLSLLVLAHAARDRQWHETSLAIGATTASVEQEIQLSTEALAKLREASEAFVVFDMSVPRGVADGVTVEIGGRAHAGSELIPTMPRLPESTSTGGRDWRQYPQWWALPISAAELPADAATPLVVRLSARRRDPLCLRADRFGDQAQVYEGPAFGESPFTVALKLEYDGDYRRTARYPLRSAATRTTLVTAQGERCPASGVARVRLVTLAQNQGWTRWQSAPAPAARTAFGFHAYTGTHGVATLSIAGQKALEVPLDATGDYEVETGPYRLCRRARRERGNMAYGAFVLEGPTERGRPLDLGLRFSTGMSERPMYVVVDSRRAFSDVAAAFDQCQVPAGVARASGAASIVDGTHNNYPADTGRWTVAAVY
jgi:4-amino-4-deoxy-L-arabinose transferase-like glycosyltransferase